MEAKLVYLQIPKSTGSSQRHLLLENYGDDKVCWRGANWDSDAIDPSELAEFQVLGGRQGWKFYADFADDLFFTAVVRDPVERALALFSHHASQESKTHAVWIKRGLDPHSMLRTLQECPGFVTQIKNFQCQFLAARDSFAATREHLQNISCLIGSYDRLDDFHQKLAELFQWRTARLPGDDQARQAEQAEHREMLLAEPGLEAALQEATREDRQLFEFVKENGFFFQGRKLADFQQGLRPRSSSEQAIARSGTQSLAEPQKDLSMLKFVIVGFPKCATSFLSYSLREFPETRIHMREPAYFDGKISLEEYLAPFELGMINGEKTPNYVYRKKSMQRISKIKDIKIIVCLRHPIRWLESIYNFRKTFPDRHPTINSYSLSDIIKSNLTVDNVGVERAHFAKSIKRNVQPFFPPEQIMYIVQEELEQDTQNHLSALCTFLGLNKDYLDKLQTKEKNKRPYVIDFEQDQEYLKLRKPLAKKYRAFNQELYEVLGRKIPAWEQIDRELMG